MVEINLKFPFVHKRGPMEVARFQGYKSEEHGDVTPQRPWQDRLPHPVNMNNYDDWANDAEANIAFNVLTDIIAGVSYYTEMPEDIDENHANKEVIDKYGEDVNLDEDLQQITMAMLQKGFCPVERLTDYDLKILPPETFYIYRNKKGKLLKYTQEYNQGQSVAEWKGKSMEDIILFFHRKTTSWPYGKSLVEPIGTLLDDRDRMNADMAKAIHRWGYPIPIMQTSKDKAALQTELEERDSDEWILIGNVMEGEVSWDTIKIDPQARFVPFIELIYYQICEGLHAPLLLYLKNATEASATVMMESVERLTSGIQRYLKRRVERFLFEPQCGEPVPRLVWGQPKTGLEEISLADVAQVLPVLAPNQQQELLKQFGIELSDPEWPEQPQLPMQQPFQKQPMAPPIEQVLDKINDLHTQLNVIYANFKEKRLPLIKAMRLGRKAIEVQMKRAYGYSATVCEQRRNEEFEKWAHRLIGVRKEKGKEFKVIVPD